MAIAELSRITESTSQLKYIPRPDKDPVGEARIFYGEYYKLEENDSPDKSRESLVKRATRSTQKLKSSDLVIDLGAGKQILEAEHADKLGNGTVITIDVANVGNDQLLARENNQIHHVQASGDNMPLADNSASVVISNMAFDFMPGESRDELRRILKPGAFAYLNLHHPSIIPPDLQERRTHIRRIINNKTRFGSSKDLTAHRMHLAALDHKNFLQTNGKLFSNPQDIVSLFQESGFHVRKAELARDEYGDKWWEVDIQKPKPDKPHGNGEARFGHATRQDIWAAERQIHERREEIARIDAAKKEVVLFTRDNETQKNDEEMQRRIESSLQEVRRELSSMQTEQRAAVRPYKEPPVPLVPNSTL